MFQLSFNIIIPLKRFILLENVVLDFPAKLNWGSNLHKLTKNHKLLPLMPSAGFFVRKVKQILH